MNRSSALAGAVVAALVGASIVAGAAFGGRPVQRLPGALAFTAGTNARGWDLFLARPSGPVEQLTHGEFKARYVLPKVWSPDGSQFLVSGVDGKYVLPADGSAEIRVIAGPVDRVAWAPDSRRIVFQDDGNAVNVVNADGGDQRRLVAGATDWALSPDGKRMAFVANDPTGDPGIFLVNTTGTPQAREIHRRPAVHIWPNGVVAGGLAWSPDGSQFAFFCCSIWWNHSSLYVMKPDGTGLRRVHLGVEADTITWSPDGRRIAFSVGFNGSNWSVMNADGSGVRTICRGCSIAWFPDGSKIAFDQTGRIAVVNSDGSHARTVVARSRRYESFSISLDGAAIAYVGRNSLYVINADGTGRRLVAHSPTTQYSAPSWQPTSP